MRIAVLSGKGGTGKTFVAANLAAAAKNSTYFDCDVEEPNGHLFFRPQINGTEAVEVLIPVVDQEKCDGCRWCVEFCQFKALAYLADQLLVFAQMCHSCGGCVLFCPQKAFREEPRAIGRIEWGFSLDTLVYSGFLEPGEESGVPIIKKLLEYEQGDRLTVIDSPPGSSCTVMESLVEADYCLLVAEPTSFGLHNLAMVQELVTVFQKPHGVLINKSFGNDFVIDDYCQSKGTRVIGSIPFDRQLGKALANGSLVVRENESYREIFTTYLEIIDQEVSEA